MYCFIGCLPGGLLFGEPLNNETLRLIDGVSNRACDIKRALQWQLILMFNSFEIFLDKVIQGQVIRYLNSYFAENSQL